MTAICGDTCDMAIDGANVSGHQFTIELGSNEIDVRSFVDSGDYGSWIACNKNGTVAVSSYERPDVDPGDTVVFTANVGSEAYSMDCVVTSQSIPVDAKDVVSFTTNMRISGNVTIV